MIVFHPPSPCEFRGRTRQHTHLSSTLLGAEGTTELLAFGRKVGLKEAWIQDRGQPKEHFDVFGSRIDRARSAGAVEVDRREFIERVVKAKRSASSAPGATAPDMAAESYPPKEFSAAPEDLPNIPWLEGELNRLAADLGERGCKMTETSDALQSCKRPRLKQLDPLERRAVLCWVETDEGRAALRRVRELRALTMAALGDWSVLAVRTVAREHFQETRTIVAWPLRTLQAIYAKLRAEQVRAETTTTSEAP